MPTGRRRSTTFCHWLKCRVTPKLRKYTRMIGTEISNRLPLASIVVRHPNRFYLRGEQTGSFRSFLKTDWFETFHNAISLVVFIPNKNAKCEISVGSES